jgi:hypothetical protein
MGYPSLYWMSLCPMIYDSFCEHRAFGGVRVISKSNLVSTCTNSSAPFTLSVLKFDKNIDLKICATFMEYFFLMLIMTG